MTERRTSADRAQRPLRIALLSLNLGPGGAERQLIQLAKCWEESGHEPEVVLLENSGEWLHELPPDVPLLTLGPSRPRGYLSRLLWMARVRQRLRRTLRTREYDVVLGFLWLPVLLAATVVDDDAVLAYSVQSDLEPSLDRHFGGEVAAWLLRRVVGERVAHFYPVSHGIEEKTRRLLGLPSDRLTVVPNGADLQRVHRLAADSAGLAPKADRPRIVTVGRLFWQKATDILLRALAAMDCGTDWECVIVGEGPERQRLEELTELLGLQNQVTFVGFQANPYAWMASADIFALPSRWEPFGIVLIEALALGCPVVASRTDGAGDIVQDGVHGRLVPTVDPPALALALGEMLCNPELRRAMAEAAAEAAPQYDIHVTAETLLVHLANLPARCRGQRR